MSKRFHELSVGQVLLIRGSGEEWRQCVRAWSVQHLGIEPGEIAYEARGKPYFPNRPELQFSVSHTRGSLCIAFANQAVGLDVEFLDRRPRGLGLAERFFQSDETEFLRGLPEAEQASAFLKLWTAKEACVKLTGEGIAHGLANCHLELGESVTRARQNGRVVHLQSGGKVDGLIATVAAWDEFQLVSVRHS